MFGHEDRSRALDRASVRARAQEAAGGGLRMMFHADERMFHVDERVVYVVEALNSLPGIATFSSCGGHPNPEPGQNEEGTWSVSFSMFPLEGGWVSLNAIAFADWMDLS